MQSQRKLIRQLIRQQRDALPLQQRQAAAVVLTEIISKLPSFQQAKHIGLYFPYNNEVDTTLLWQACCEQNKLCYFPVLIEASDNHLIFLPYQQGDQIRQNHYGIPEPIVSHEHAINLRQLDIVFTPLVAFDKVGNRLGMGVGYYDRTFADLHKVSVVKPLLFGLAYELQKVDHIPAAEWDVPLSAIVTEKRVYWGRDWGILQKD